MKLTVFFDGQFWVGLIERDTEAGLLTLRHVFGAEPKDKEVLAFVNDQLIAAMNSQATAVSAEEETNTRMNPKRMAREVARAMKATPVSTKAQEALRLQLEENKKEKRTLTRAQKRQEQEKEWLSSQEKAKKKRQGR